jgi:RNA polymerase sigma-70 factor (ECF subfamily)
MGEDFLQAYEDHVWDIYGYLAYRGAGTSDAEDLTQTTFERALRAWNRFDPERASAKTWLLAIARNAYIDFRRSDRSGRNLSISGGEVSEGELPQHPDPADRSRLDPEIAAAIRRLSRREREALALRFGADLRGPEIAELLDITLANAQQLLSRGLRKVRNELDQREQKPAAKRKPSAKRKAPAKRKPPAGRKRSSPQ